MSLRQRVASALLAVPLLAAAAACGGGGSEPPAPPAEVKVAGTIVSTATSTNEAQVVVPGPVAASWTALGQRGSGVENVVVGGDAAVQRSTTDVASDPGKAPAALAAAINEHPAAADGRSAFAGLAAVTSPAKAPVWVFSPLLDTVGPLDFNQLAFDTRPVTVVKGLKKAGDLPDLSGREVTFVVTPSVGAQQPLSKLQVGYQRAVWEGVAKAAGAKRVVFYDGTGTGAGTGTITPVPIPDPNDEFDSAEEGSTRTCTLPAPALFVSDQPTLIDKKATKAQLKKCVGTLDSSTKITVEGHTAGVSGDDNAFAKSLSTQRATEIAAVLKDLDVPAKNIVKVVGYGSSKPLVKPDSNPKNRAVVVTFTSAG